MCRFVLYLGESLTLDLLTTRPAHSLIRQSYKAQERREPLNGDGFGIAWYANSISDEPALFRATTPAWNNANLRELARVTQSHCILAHVRAATPPLPVIELNCHPFVHGRLALMHNGYIPAFGRLRRKILAGLSDEAFQLIKGSTDSEHLLAMLVDRLARVREERARASNGSAQAAAEEDTSVLLAEALTATIADLVALLHENGIEEAPRLNLAVSDGSAAVVSRFCGHEPDKADSLYLHQGKRYTCEDGVCHMVEPDNAQSAVIVASEALSSDPGWDKVPPNHLVRITAKGEVELRAL